MIAGQGGGPAACINEVSARAEGGDPDFPRVETGKSVGRIPGAPKRRRRGGHAGPPFRFTPPPLPTKILPGERRPWGLAMERFIRRKNIEHYRELLKTVTDEAERVRILELLAEEQEKQRDAGDSTQE